MRRNSFDVTGECQERGERAERSFVSFARERLKWVVEGTSFREDALEHKDLKITTPDREIFHVDVKSQRKIGRNDEETSTLYTWLEVLGVNGTLGSIYGSRSSYIVFDTIDEWSMVKLSVLREFLTTKLSGKVRIVDDPYVALEFLESGVYTIYARGVDRGRIVLTPLSEIRKMAAITWRKDV